MSSSLAMRVSLKCARVGSLRIEVVCHVVEVHGSCLLLEVLDALNADLSVLLLSGVPRRLALACCCVGCLEGAKLVYAVLLSSLINLCLSYFVKTIGLASL